MQYLAGHTAATLRGCGYALQQNLDKATKAKPKTVQKMLWTEVHALFFGLAPVSLT